LVAELEKRSHQSTRESSTFPGITFFKADSFGLTLATVSGARKDIRGGADGLCFECLVVAKLFFI
jgi:hypothetical protein